MTLGERSTELRCTAVSRVSSVGVPARGWTRADGIGSLGCASNARAILAVILVETATSSAAR